MLGATLAMAAVIAAIQAVTNTPQALLVPPLASMTARAFPLSMPLAVYQGNALSSPEH
jgi:hypothetical protein